MLGKALLYIHDAYPLPESNCINSTGAAIVDFNPTTTMSCKRIVGVTVFPRIDAALE